MRVFLFILMICKAAFALNVISDSHESFVFTDKIESLSAQKCGEDVLYMPENSSFAGEHEKPGVPYRVYVIALPNSTPPSVHVENLTTESVRSKPCGAKGSNVTVGKPYLKDNLWMVKVEVPLLFSTGSSWSARKAFKVNVRYQDSKRAGFPAAKRALMYVKNTKGAANFGTQSPQTKLPVLRNSIVGNTNFLLRMSVGDVNLSQINADGMIAVSFDELERVLRAAGRDMYGIPVSRLRLFGAPADTLSEGMGKDFSPNLTEIPIIVKDNDGTFNTGDSIIFFGYGTALWKKSKSASGMDYYYSHSPYSFYQYFYLGYSTDASSGKRLASSSKTISGARDITWKRYVRAEKDMILRDKFFGSQRIIEENTGKEWAWTFGNKESDVSVRPDDQSIRDLNGLSADSALVGVSFFPWRSIGSPGGYSDSSFKSRMRARFSAEFNGTPLQGCLDTIEGGTFVYSVNRAKKADNTYKVTLLGGGSQEDRFDGVSVAYAWNPLESSGGDYLLPGNESGAIKIPKPAGADIIKIYNGIPQEIIENGSDTVSATGDTRYFLQKGGYKKPASINAITETTSLDIPENTEYLIITTEKFKVPANKLKDFRHNGNTPRKFNTSVVWVEDIYRNYGAQPSPVAIRDYLRYAKNRSSSLYYVLLAGNGHYDYRNLRSYSQENHIPPYENEDMSSDDFFAILDSGEAIRFGRYNLSMAIGRLPVNTAQEFENYLQKAQEYEQIDKMDNGIWRNTIIFAADDAIAEGKVETIKHTEQMERFSSTIDSTAKSRNFAFEMRKIPLMQYEMNSNQKKPEAAKELIMRLNQGALFTSYFGHGSATLWAEEDLLNLSSVNELTNSPRYTIIGAFTCLAARFDDLQISLAEKFLTEKSKGAIATIGALRVSFAGYNENLATKIFNQSLFTPGITIGKAIWEAKLAIGDEYKEERYNNEKYVLLGEPVLSMPNTGINLSLNSVPDTIQALQKLSLSGTASVQSGKVRLQVLEGEKYRTIAEKNNECNNSTYCTAKIKTTGSPIYSEDLDIKNGRFATEFTTPRKLSLGDTSAQIRLYAWGSGKDIGRSLKGNIVLEGTSADSLNDSEPPSIKVYPCMRAGKTAPFADDAKINLEIPACLDIIVEDSTGLDYREEADEGIVFEVAPTQAPWHPWSFEEQTSKRVKVKMHFSENSYEAGEYTFKVSAQDILGNAALRSMKVILSKDIRDGLADVFNIPNPMGKNGTTFYFKDMSGDRRSDVTIKIFDQHGKQVRVLKNAISGITKFDGRDTRGHLLANGLYHYVVESAVYSLDGNSKKTYTKKQKLVISK